MQIELTTAGRDGKRYSEKQLAKGTAPDGIYHNGNCYVVVDGDNVVAFSDYAVYDRRALTETDEDYVRIPDGQTVTIKLTQEPTDEAAS